MQIDGWLPAKLIERITLPSSHINMTQPFSADWCR